MTTSVSPTILFASLPGHRVTVEHVLDWSGVTYFTSEIRVYIDGVHIGSVDVPRMLPAELSSAAGHNSPDPACGVAAGPGEHHP